MKLRSKEADEEVEIDMSPMIDMVFLLLIFFIVTFKVIAEKPQVNIPTAKAVSVLPPEDDKSMRYMISISKTTENGADKYEYYLQDNVDNDEPFDNVVLGIEGAVKTVNASETERDLFILIRADSDVPFSETKKIMNACAQAGVFNMIFAAREVKE